MSETFLLLNLYFMHHLLELNHQEVLIVVSLQKNVSLTSTVVMP